MPADALLTCWLPVRLARSGPGARRPQACRASNLVGMAGAVAERSFEIRTYGCPMNVHDSERLAGLLEVSGYIKADNDSDELADVVVSDTCAVRQTADNKLYGNLGQLSSRRSC